MAKPKTPLLQQLSDAHDTSREKFDNIKSAADQLKRGRGILGTLLDKGDTVTVDDVVKAAGKMVGAGFDAKAMAGLLATLPPENPAGQAGPANAALQGWVQQRDQALTALEQQAEQALSLAAHDMGVHALRALAGHSLQEPPPVPPQLGQMPAMGAPTPQSQTVTAPPMPGNALGAGAPSPA